MTAPADGAPPTLPLPGESFDGYLARRAALAMMPGPFAIASLAGATHAQYPELAFGGDEEGFDLEAVAASLGIDASELRSRTHPSTTRGRRAFGSTDIDRRLIERRSRRFSPTSIGRSAHHRALWAVRCLPFCEESRETLTDRCPAPYCGAVQRWRRSSGIDRCDVCGGSLLGAATFPLPKEDWEDLGILCGLLHHDPARVARSLSRLPDYMIRRLSAGEIVEAACAIAGLHDPGVRARAAALVDPGADPRRIASAMAQASRALRDWPRAGERLAGRRLATRVGRFGDGNEGATLDFVALEGPRAAGAGARTVAAMLAGALRDNRSRGLAIKEAVAGTGLKVSALAALRRKGEVETILHLTDDDRVLPLITHAAAAALRHDRGTGPELRSVAVAFAMPCHGVEQLLATGLLGPAAPGRVAPFAPSDRIDPASVAELMRRLREASTAEGRACWPTLAHVARSTGGDVRPWAAWIMAMLSGRVPFRLAPNDDPLASRLSVHPSSLRLMREMVVAGRYRLSTASAPMSRAEAADVLGIHARHHAAAFAAWPAAGRRSEVPVAEVRRLAATWMSFGELGCLLDVSRQAAVRLAERAGLSRGPLGIGRREGAMLVQNRPGSSSRRGTSQAEVASPQILPQARKPPSDDRRVTFPRRRPDGAAPRPPTP